MWPEPKVVPDVDSSGNDFMSEVIGNKNDTVGGDSAISLLKQVVLATGGEATQLRTDQSKSGAVEENGVLGFSISIFDIDSGAIASADIDITGISAVMEKSTGGGAFATAGITQPTFSKSNGLVECDYQFKAAEWAIGDIYKLTVSGITATIGSDTAYVKTMIWSNVIFEEANIETKIDAIQTDIGDPSARTNLQTIVAMLGNPDAAGKTIYDVIGDFVGQTNLQSLLAALAIPDTAGKGLFVELATDRLDNGTHGLAALKTLIDTIDTVVDAIKAVTDNLPDSGALTTIDGKLDTIDTVVDAIKAVTDNLPDSGALTSIAQGSDLAVVDGIVDAIKAVTDNLPDSGALTSIAQEATLNVVDGIVDAIKAVTDNLPDSGALTSIAQASALAVVDGYHDVPSQDSASNAQMRDAIGNKTDTTGGDSLIALVKLVDTIVDAIKAVTDVLPDSGALTSIAQKAENTSDDSSGTYAYLNAGAEQDVVEITNSTRKIIHGAWLDLANMTQDGDVRVYYKIDGSTYRLVDTARWVQGTDPVGFYVDLNMGITEDIKITYEEVADETADRNIPYSVVYEEKE